MVLGIREISECAISSKLVDVRIIMRASLLCNASWILFPNHPSGNLKPSGCDIKMTSLIKKATKILSMSLLDHVIITSDSHFSFGDNGMI